MNVERELDNIERTIETLGKQWEFLREHKSLFENCQFKVVTAGSPRIIISNIDQLSEARKFMRELFGTWHDKVRNVFYSCGTAIAVWQDKDHEWEIWLECRLEEFPQNLLPSESCYWKETTSKDYNLVCEVK